MRVSCNLLLICVILFEIKDCGDSGFHPVRVITGGDGVVFGIWRWCAGFTNRFHWRAGVPLDLGADAFPDEVRLAEPIIRFEAVVNSVRLMTSDNTVRVVLDLPETAIAAMAMLAQTKVDGIVLDVQVRAKSK